MFMVTGFSVSPRVEEERYVALLRAANEIATCNDCDAASTSLVKKLREVTAFDYLHVIAFDKETDAACWSLLDVNGTRLDSFAQEGFSLEESPFPWVHQSRQPLVAQDWSQSTRFHKYGLFLEGLGICSTCTLPLIRGSRSLGVLALGRRYPNAYDGEEIHFLGLVAEQIGLAIDAAVNFFISQRVQDQLKLILDLTNQVVSKLELPDLLHAASGRKRKISKRFGRVYGRAILKNARRAG